MASLATPVPTFNDDVLTFDEILEGEAGPLEAEAARGWLAQGSPIEALPRDLVVTIGARAYLDTRVGAVPAEPGSSDSKGRPRQSGKEGTRRGQTKAAPRKFVAHRNGPSPMGPATRPVALSTADSPGSGGRSKRERDGSPSLLISESEDKAAAPQPAVPGPAVPGTKTGGMDDLSAAPGWSFKLSMYNQPMFISPEGLCCNDWDEVKAYVRSTRRIGGLSNAALLQWLREIATGQWAGRSTHPASLARMVVMQRWRACTFSGEREARMLRAAAAGTPAIGPRDAVDLTG